MRPMVGSPGSGCAGPRAGYDAVVQMNEADAREHLLPGEAADGLTLDAAGRVVGAVVPEAPLPPGVVGVALDRRAARVGDDRDRAEVVLVEVAQGDARALDEAHADHRAAHHQ